MGFPDSSNVGYKRKRSQGLGPEHLEERRSHQLRGAGVGGRGGEGEELSFRHAVFEVSVSFAEMSRRPWGIF